MKTFLIVSCLLATAAAISTEDLRKLSEAWEDQIANCGIQYGIPVKTMQDVYEQEQSRGISNSPCLHFCMQKSLGLLNDSGIDQRKLDEYIQNIFADQPEEVTKLERAGINCAPDVTENGDDECATAYRFAQCFADST